MARLDYNQLIKKDLYQVFLFVSPASFPVQYAKHAWFVINKRGIISRWEVIFNANYSGTHWGNIYKDFSKPFDGVTILPYVRGFCWKNIQLLGAIEGGEDSLACKMINFIERSPERYPYKDTYRLLGPNSNTYIQWILDNFPEWQMVLPRRAVGKNFKIRV